MPRPATRCFACGARGLMPFYEQRNLPVRGSLLMPSRAEALSYPRGDLRLAFCGRCGFIQNVLFDGNRLEQSSRYEGAQASSARSNEYAVQLAGKLIESYDLHGKDILEIGCGKGEFLTLLCEKGENRGLGIDPAYAPEIGATQPASIEFIADAYSERYLDRSADFVCCRHTLEQIQPVHDFVGVVRRSIGDNQEPVVFFEVADVGRTLSRLAFWDLQYERCSYFSLGSLARLFRSCDFNVFDLRKANDDKYLFIDAVASSGDKEPCWESEDDIDELRRLVAHFRDNSASRLHEWSRSLHRVRSEVRKAVLWGSGSKAVSYLNNLEVRDDIEFVVDINPNLHGRFLAGSGHEVVSPGFLREYRPDLVIAMNPLNLAEIGDEMQRLGVEAEIMAV